ncbi:hypothetical protein [Cohnella caldifontis]|uniref:hypothetical protein n=1 Tax=Cohnella caldifontis TaxID=3027471 RepID=UPI0023EB0273|nr:hypothetical protein [Cohnella sp. YIM B05605]
MEAAGIVQTRVVWKDPFQVVGEKIRFDPSGGQLSSENEIARLWPRFSERAGENGTAATGIRNR